MPLKIGGQAVIEGVMIRSPHRVATAVRRVDGTIEIKSFPFISLTKKNKCLNLPVIRGAISLYEMLNIGIKTLTWSAEIAARDESPDMEQKPEPLKEALFTWGSVILAFVIALLLFMYLPYLITQNLSENSRNQFLFHLIAGTIRIFIFMGYIYVLTLFKDFRRIFAYHGAEHKSIFAFEKTGKVEVGESLKFPRFHPRCGTSFLLISVIFIILLMAILDSIIVPIVGNYKNSFIRFLVHLPFLPAIAGISYEILKWAGENTEVSLVNLMIKPGLWLQKLTTQEPDEKQLEVAVTAIKSALNEEDI
jgi:uncharacterized protein YqhQ